MDHGIWATWYDLPAERAHEYIDWLHGTYLPGMLQRSGYLWAAHVRNVTTPGRETDIKRRLIHTSDASVPAGYAYLLLFGAENAHVFADPTPSELLDAADARTKEMLALQQGARPVIFTEVERVDGPAVGSRHPGITPGPILQLGAFNVASIADEIEVSAWYARHRLPMMRNVDGCVGARKLVSVAGWAKHGILYEFTGVENPEGHFADPDPWSSTVIRKLEHAPHSPTLGTRIWP